MKRLDDYTNEDLCALDEEAIAHLVNVTACIDEAREDQRLRERIRSQFDEYCDLTSGDCELALTFLLKTGRYVEDIVRTTLNMELPKEMEHDDEEN